MSLHSLNDFVVKMLNFTICGGRKRATTIFFSLSELGYSSWEFNSRRVRLHLTKKVSWNLKRDEDWQYASSLFRRLFFFRITAIVHIPACSIRQMLAVISRICILKDCIAVQEKKKKVVVLCSQPPQNVKWGIFMSESCNDGGKKLYKKA